MAEIDTHSKVTTPRLGPAPARIGMADMCQVEAATEEADSTKVIVQNKADLPSPLAWMGKRLGMWCAGTFLSAEAFHLTGFVLIGIIAITFPIVYWIYIIFEGQRIWGPDENPSRWDHWDAMMRRARDESSRKRRLGF